MQFDRLKIESALLSKGFTKDQGPKHQIFIFKYKGKEIGIQVGIPRGSKYRTLQNGYLKIIQKQLYFDDKIQLKKFIKCPIEHKDYIQILRVKNKI